MTTEERIDKLENRVEKIENNMHEQSETNLKNNYELKDLIRNAVEEGNEKILQKLETHEQRIIKLENQDGEKAKLILKSISATTLGWVVLGILNNFMGFIGK
jgi:cell division septum initiation protein DivIVA